MAPFRQTICEQNIPYFDSIHISLKVGFFPRKKTKIKANKTRVIVTNLSIGDITNRNCKIFVKSEHVAVQTEGILSSKYHGNLKVRIVNNQSEDIIFTRDSYLGYILFLPIIEPVAEFLPIIEPEVEFYNLRRKPGV